MITIGELANWIVQHRRRTAFPYTISVLMAELNECAEKDSMLCITNSEGDKVEGIVCWRLDIEKKILFVMDILATSPGVVKNMMRVFKIRFDGFTIQGTNRNGRARNFTNPDKLLKRL